MPGKCAFDRAARILKSVSSLRLKASSNPLRFLYISVRAICEHVAVAPMPFGVGVPMSILRAAAGPCGARPLIFVPIVVSMRVVPSG